ncbi:hypothetical protein CIC12_30650 [Burkholderia sp. SG-MS1]|nr:hypothetical protein [Paraburkholderia sp. SG-MS1]
MMFDCAPAVRTRDTSYADELIQAIASRILTQSGCEKMGVEARGENEVQRGVWRLGKLLENECS